MSAATPRPPHPVAFAVEYPESLSRLTTFFRLILVIPQLIVVYLLQTAASVVSIIAWFAILFTGAYPKGLFDFSLGALRWGANVGAYASLFRDEYPPFSWEPGEYPLTLEVPWPERQSRWRLFIRFFAILPNQIVFVFVQLAASVASFIAWFAIMITGRYPRGLFTFAVGVMRWSLRQQAYVLLLRDEYPPYSISADARPGNEVVSAVIGLPLLAGLVALAFLPFVGLLGGETDTVHVQSRLTSPAFAAEAPSGESNGVRITLLGYNDSALQPFGVDREPGYRFVAFAVRAEKDGFFPTFFTPFLLRLEDCRGFDYFPESVNGGFEVEFFWTGGEAQGTAVYQIPLFSRPCELVYHSGLGKVEFIFEGGM